MKGIKMGQQCNRCGTTNVKFRFYNNKKADQPRYQCLECTSVTGKPYFFNPNPKRPHHKDGYAKLPKEETEELKNLEKVCDKCHAVNNVKFRGYNNGSMNQPRYVCKGCNQLFSPLKKSNAIRVVETEGSNQFQTQPATSEASHQQNPSLLLLQQQQQQQQMPPEFRPPHLQTPVQNNNQTTSLQQQNALQNQSYFQTRIHYYHSNPTPPSQQQTPTGIQLSHFPPAYPNNHTTIQQQPIAPRFNHQPLVTHNLCNQRNFQQQQIRTEIQQPHSQPIFQNNLHNQTTIQQQQIAPRNQQLHYQSRIPQNYRNPRTLLQPQIPTGISQRHRRPSFQINFNQATYLVPVVQIPSVNQQQQPFQPVSQSNSNHPDAQNSGELGVSPTTASISANCSSTASPLTRHQSSVPFTEDILEEYKIFEEPYFKEMMNSRDNF